MSSWRRRRSCADVHREGMRRREDVAGHARPSLEGFVAGARDARTGSGGSPSCSRETWRPGPSRPPGMIPRCRVVRAAQILGMQAGFCRNWTTSGRTRPDSAESGFNLAELGQLGTQSAKIGPKSTKIHQLRTGWDQLWSTVGQHRRTCARNRDQILPGLVQQI